MLSGAHRDEARGNGAILVFDEDPVVLDLLTAILHREGYRVTPTRRWEEAHRLVTSLRYDLAVAELDSRRRDGCRLVTTLRNVSPETPIVATTAYPAEEVVTFAEEHVEALLAKPFGIGELLEVVRSALDGHATSHAGGMASFAPRQQNAQMLAAGG
jgi:DNA-binding response OmpR family regulator